MNWKFWQKSDDSAVPGQPQVKLPGPKDIPEAIGMHMVVSLQKTPDWVWTLKAVMLNRPGSKDAKDIRIFDPSKAAVQRVAVKNYRSLDAHPELILYEGWFNKNTRKFEIAENTAGTVKAA